MLKHIRILPLRLFHRPIERQRRLRIEPLESRSLLSATGFALPAEAVAAFVAAVSNPTQVMETAPAETAAANVAQSLPDYSAQVLRHPFALAPVAPNASTVDLGAVAVATKALRTSPLVRMQVVDGPVARGVDSNASSPVQITADATNAVMALVEQRLPAAFAFSISSYGNQVVDDWSQHGNEFSSVFFWQEPAGSGPGANIRAAFPSSLSEHPATTRSMTVHVLSAARASSDLESVLRSTALTGESENRAALEETQTTPSSETANSSGAALSLADLASALDLLAGGSVLRSQKDFVSFTLRNGGEAVHSEAELETALDEALPELISPLAPAESAPRDAADEAGYVRIGSTKASPSSDSSGQYDSLEQIWRDGQSVSQNTVRQAADHVRAGGLEARTLKNRLRRGSQAGDDEGMIQLVVASSASTRPALSAELGYTEGVSSIATRDVQIHEALGQFQAFELAGAGDEEAMAPLASVSATTTGPSAAHAAAVDEMLGSEPVQHAATALGMVVLSMLTAFHEKRKEETAAECDSRPVTNKRSPRIDRLS